MDYLRQVMPNFLCYRVLLETTKHDSGVRIMEDTATQLPQFLKNKMSFMQQVAGAYRIFVLVLYFDIRHDKSCNELCF